MRDSFYSISGISSATEMRDAGHRIDRKHESFYGNEAMKTEFERGYGFRGGDSQETLEYMRMLGLKPMQYGQPEIPEMQNMYGHDLYLAGEKRDGADLASHEVGRMNASYYLDSSKMSGFELNFGGMGESRETYQYMKAHNLPHMHYHNPEIPGIETLWNSASIYAHGIYLPGTPEQVEHLRNFDFSNSGIPGIETLWNSASIYENGIYLPGTPEQVEHLRNFVFGKAEIPGIEELWGSDSIYVHDINLDTTPREKQAPGMKFGTPSMFGMNGVEEQDTALLKLVIGTALKDLGMKALENLASRIGTRENMSSEEKAAALDALRRHVNNNVEEGGAKDALLRKIGRQSSKFKENAEEVATPSTPELVRKESTDARPAAKRKLFSEEDESGTPNQADLDYAASAQERMDGFVQVLRLLQEKKAPLDDTTFYDLAINFLLGRLDILNQSAGGLDKDLSAQIDLYNKELDDFDSEARQDATDNPDDPLRPFNLGKESEIEFFSGGEKLVNIEGLELLISALLAQTEEEHFAKLREAMSKYYEADIALLTGSGEALVDDEVSEFDVTEALPAQMDELNEAVAAMLEKANATSDANLIKAYNIGKAFLLGKISGLYTSMIDMKLRPQNLEADILSQISDLDTKRAGIDNGTIQSEDDKAVAASYLSGRVSSYKFIKSEVFGQEDDTNNDFIDSRINALEHLLIYLNSKKSDAYADEHDKRDSETDLGVAASLLALRKALENMSDSEREETILDELNSGEAAIMAQKKFFDDNDLDTQNGSPLFSEAADDDVREMSSAESACEDVGVPVEFHRSESGAVLFTIDMDSGTITYPAKKKSYKKYASNDDEASSESSDGGIIMVAEHSDDPNKRDSFSSSGADDEDDGSSSSGNYQTLGSFIGKMPTSDAFKEGMYVVEYEPPTITISDDSTNGVQVVPSASHPLDYVFEPRPPRLMEKQDSHHLMVPARQEFTQDIGVTGGSGLDISDIDFV